MKDTKIILFTDCLGAGGAQRQLVGLAIMLKEIGYKTIVATYFDIDFYKKELDDAGVLNIIIPGADNKKKRIFAVREYLKSEKPDWVIAYQETPSFIACIAKILGCKFRLIVSERNTTQTIGIMDRIRFFLFRFADFVVPNSYSQEKFLVENYNWMKYKIKTITNFVDLNHFNYVERKKNSIPKIIVVASIWNSKNTLGFIDSIKLLVDEGYKFHIEWYGKSETNLDYFCRCKQKIDNYAINDYIELKEKTIYIKEVYQNADFFCLPSFYEGTPNVICEAISTGLPVICSDVCDNHIYVHHKFNGFLFNPKYPEDIAKKISQAILLPEKDYIDYQKNCRTIAEKELSKSRFLNLYMNIIES